MITLFNCILCQCDSIFQLNNNISLSSICDKMILNDEDFVVTLSNANDFYFFTNLQYMRLSIFDEKQQFLNKYKYNSKLPDIFKSKNIKNKNILDVLYRDVAKLYYELTILSSRDKNSLQYHMTMNDIEIYLYVKPIIDDTEDIIGYIIVEIPYTKIQTLII